MTQPKLERQKSMDKIRKRIKDKLQDVELSPTAAEKLGQRAQSGELLASTMIVIPKLRHLKTNSNVDEAIEKAVKESDRELEGVLAESEVESLASEIAEALTVAKVWVNEAPKHVDGVKGVADKLDALADFEFVKVSSSGSRTLANAQKLREAAQSLIDGPVKKVAAAHQKLLEAQKSHDVEAVRKLIVDATESGQALAGKYHALGLKGKEAIDTAITMMDEKVVKAWVKENPDETSKWLDRGLAVVGSGLDVAEEALSDSPGAAFTPILSAFKVLYTVVIKRQVIAYDAKRQVRKKQLDNVKGHGFALADEDSTLIAKEVARQQKANFDGALVAVGFLAAEIPGWSIISTVIKKAGHAYYNERVRRAKEIAGKTSEKTWEERESEAKDAVLDEIAESLPGTISIAVTEGIEAVMEAGVEGLADMAVDFVIGRVMTALAEYLPIEPAQIVTGEQMRAAVGELQSQQLIRRYGVPEEVEGVGATTVECPTEDDEGRPVDKILQSGSEKDGRGRFFWVKIGSETGRIYVEDKSFVAVSSLGMAFPEQDKDGRAIDEILSKYTNNDKPGSQLLVRMGDLVGVYYNNGRFEPIRPAHVGEWSAREITIDSYKEGRMVVSGTWSKCRGTRYLFIETSSGRDWAEIDQRTASSFNFHELFEHSRVREVDIATLAPVRS